MKFNNELKSILNYQIQPIYQLKKNLSIFYKYEVQQLIEINT